MKEGGERVEREGDENTGWESVAELAGKMDSEEKASKSDFEMYLATVGEVDAEDVALEVRKYTDKIERGELEKIYDEWAADPEEGASLAVKYFTELFEVEPAPRFDFVSKDELDAEQEVDSGGSYQDDEEGGIIFIDEDGSDEDDVRFRIAVIGHEMWHARQYRMAKIVDDERGSLYRYNIDNYIEKSDSPGLYKEQLVEAEAYAVGKTISDLLAEHEREVNASRWAEVEEALKPEKIKEVVDGVMRGFSKKSFLSAVGVSGLDELEENYRNDLVEVVDGIVRYFSGLLGGGPYEVEEIGWRQGIGADVEERRILLNLEWAQEQKCNEMIAMTANILYWLCGAEKRCDLDDKRGRIYRYGERVGKDVLRAESSAFAEAFKMKIEEMGASERTDK